MTSVYVREDESNERKKKEKGKMTVSSAYSIIFLLIYIRTYLCTCTLPENVCSVTQARRSKAE